MRAQSDANAILQRDLQRVGERCAALLRGVRSIMGVPLQGISSPGSPQRSRLQGRIVTCKYANMRICKYENKNDYYSNSNSTNQSFDIVMITFR